MRSGRESWRVSRTSRDMYGELFHEIAIGQVRYLPDIEPLMEGGLPADAKREMLRGEQQQFLQTMALMEELEGDEPPALDLRVGKPAGFGTTPKLLIAVIGRVTSRHSDEAESYVRTLWSRLSTAFPRSYGFAAPAPDDARFLNTVLPSPQDLQNASIWELVKETHSVPRGVGRGYTAIVGTYSELLDSMIASWDALAYSRERVLLSLRCVPLPGVDMEALGNEADWNLRNFGGSFVRPQDMPLMEEAQLRFNNLLSSAQLLRLRIQIASWNNDPFEVKMAIKASLTTTPDLSQRSCACSWLSCSERDDRERAKAELAYVYAEKQELDISPHLASPAQPYTIPPVSTGRSFFVSDYDVVNVREASAAWRLPLARRYGIAGVEFKRDPLFTPEPLTTAGSDTPRPLIGLGRVLSRAGDRRIQQMEADKLVHHMLVLGETGMGKSTTTQSIVLQLWQEGIPSLIIDPISSEYRELYALSSLFREGKCRSSAEGSKDEDCSLCVFTPGEAGDAGTLLAFNPFCPQPGISVDSHIMTLKSCFGSAFGMPDAWRELVGRALRSLYQDYGWPAADPQHNRQAITEADLEQRPFPTMVDLIKSIEREVVKYGSGEFRSNTEAGLLGRLRDLASGPLGALIQTRQGLDVARLVKRPVVIELNKLRESDAKSLIMLFLLTQLRQHYDTLRRSSTLRHLIIVEEAHRLLAPAPVQFDTVNNSKAESINIVVDMLAELRKHGVGLMLVEQLPTRLEQNVVKLPVTKILHRLSAQDDREMLASAMNMTQEQTKYAATLSRGEAALFTEGLTEPTLLHMLNPWDPDDLDSDGRFLRPLKVDEQEALEREVEEHTAKVWPAPTHKETPWDPCKWCKCGCRPRIRLIAVASPWWIQVNIDEFVNKVLREYSQASKEKRKLSGKYLGELARELWTQVETHSPQGASSEERRCGLALAAERYICRIATRQHSQAIVRSRERAIDLLLSSL